ncbi:hypothetical protein GCM10011332_04560 [Terasakiella brassicae]|uniref:Uncharacterized protein n=1 Tax=Terasakiella brassicae TaxID=1634917 RepID=A0A917BQX8_9PROT|nr:hypothetical protein GCM10011332_04560 [Terasakiella brassicae]
MIISQNQRIDELRKIVQSNTKSLPNNENYFGAWVSILLAAVTVVVTVFGVVIAILSFFGYRETLKKATEVAEEKATETAGAAAKAEIERLVSAGEFNDSIELAVDKVVYKGIIPGNPADWDNGPVP